jgi:hypothetical protein
MERTAMNNICAVSKRTTVGAKTYRGLRYELVIRLRTTTKFKITGLLKEG